MKTIRLLSLCLLLTSFSLQSNAVVKIDNFSDSMNAEFEHKDFPWAEISAISGVIGLVLSFTPWLSIIGLGLCLGAVITAIYSWKKKGRKLWKRMGLLFGSLGILALLAVIGLMNFF